MNREEAERKIAGVLAELERDSGQTVTNLGLHGIEVTSLGDANRRVMQHVRIEQERLPGNDWAI